MVTGDVYRKDAIDRGHYPIFHQMEGVQLCQSPGLYLGLAIESMISFLFPECEFRRTDSYFPFTEPSFEYEINWKGEWIEVLGCGIIRDEIIKGCGLDGEKGWAFGIGLDRLAMILFDIPDIRLLWSEDERFTNQFSEGEITKFKSFSRQPSCYKDVSFWLTNKFSVNDFYEMVRTVGSDLVESVDRIDAFVKGGRESHCYRINYRSVDRTLTNEEVDTIQERIRGQLAADFGVEIR